MAPALAPGSHTASAAYSGDASFNASQSKPLTFSVTPGTPFINDSINAPPAQGVPGFNVTVGGSLTIGITVGPSSGGILGTVAPSGTVTACLGAPGNVTVSCANPTFSQTANLTSGSGNNSQSSSALVTFSNLAAGTYTPSYSYSGDANWKPRGLVDLAFVNVIPVSSLATSTTTVSITPSSISGADIATLTTTVTGTGSTAPTGQVDVYDNNIFRLFFILPAVKSGSTVSASIELIPLSFQTNGVNRITAIYAGDANYAASTSNVSNISVIQSGDFSLVSQLPQITLKSGSSANVLFNLASLSNFNGNVTLTCAPSSSQISCNVNPSTVTLNGTATATLTVNASAQAAKIPAHHPGRALAWLGAGGGFLFASVFVGGLMERKRRLNTWLLLCIVGVLLAVPGCGGGSSQSNQPPPPPPSPPTTATLCSVLVSATANGVTHNSKVLVAVQ